jgi:phytoene synthase
LGETLSEIGAQVRSVDPERFYAALFAPAQKREALFALLAFNYEVARVRESVTEPTLGEMRLAWWHEVLDAIDAKKPPRAHPVAAALSAAHGTQPFTLSLLRTLIDARSFDLYTEPMADLGALETYAAATGGGLHRAMAECLLGSSEALDAARECGTAWALTGIVRALGVHSARGQLYLPHSELQAHGIAPDIVFAGSPTKALSAVIRSVIASARAHLDRARGVKIGAALPALLPGALLPAHWRRIANTHDPFRFATGSSQIATMARLLIAAASGKI